MPKFKPGDKVIRKSKSIGVPMEHDTDRLRREGKWDEAKQPYLFVTGYHENTFEYDEPYYQIWSSFISEKGNNYAEGDLELYKPYQTKEEALEALIKGDINQELYETYV